MESKKRKTIIVKFKGYGEEWESISDKTARMLLSGYYQENEIDLLILEIKETGKMVETLTAYFKRKEDETKN